MAIKILENLLINKEEWELAPFKFNVSELNFVSGGDAPIPDTPDLTKLLISATPVTDEKYHLANGALFGLEAGTIETDEYIYNIDTQGAITNNNGYISGFSTSNYAIVPNTFAPANKSSWSFDFKIVAPSTITATETVIAFKDNNSTLIDITVTNDRYVKCTINGTTKTFDVISGGEEKQFKLDCDGRGLYTLYYYKSIAGMLIPTAVATISAQNLPSCNIYFGSNGTDSAYSGSINLNACSIKLDNQIWWESKSRVILTTEEGAELVNYIAGLYTDNPGADYFTTEADWQTEVTQHGVCDKYVYDSTYNTVRIPKYGNNAYYYIKVKE